MGHLSVDFCIIHLLFFVDIFISYCQDDLLENQTEKVVDPRHVHKDLVNNGFKWLVFKGHIRKNCPCS